MNEKINKLANRARKNRLDKMNRLIGHCYENAEEMSRLLYNENISHDLYYVGIITDVVQYTDSDPDQCVKANKKDEYDKEVPEFRDELPDSANHYTIVINRGGNKIVTEPCSELRDENFRDVYVGEWPDKDYLLLKDSKIKKETRFEHFK